MRHIGSATQVAHFMIFPEIHQSVNRTPVEKLINIQQSGCLKWNYTHAYPALLLLDIKCITVRWIADLQTKTISVQSVSADVNMPKYASLDKILAAVIKELEKEFGKYGDIGYTTNEPNRTRLYISAVRFPDGITFNLDREYRYQTEDAIAYKNAKTIESAYEKLTPPVKGPLNPYSVSPITR